MLVKRAQEGDREAFHMIYNRYHRRIYMIILGIVGHEQDALDLAQDTFVKAYHHLSSFQGDSGFFSWLYRIALNRSIDHKRKGKRASHHELSEHMVQHSFHSPETSGWLQQHKHNNPYNEFAKREVSRKITRALEQLSDAQRILFVLRDVQGLSYAELADVLQIPKGTVMSRLFNARRRMKELLSEELSSDSLSIIEEGL